MLRKPLKKSTFIYDKNALERRNRRNVSHHNKSHVINPQQTLSSKVKNGKHFP